MVSNSQVMDNQRGQYNIPPPPPLNQNPANLSHLPPPPPRFNQQQSSSTLPPPPPGPHPSSLPPGTVYGLNWGQQGWARPGQTLPPPPPLSQNASYNASRQPGMNIPPPPPQYNDKPVLSATFIPTGDSFGPGVGIPPLDDFSTFSRYDQPFTAEPSRNSGEPRYSDGTYNPHSYSYPNPSQPNPDIANRENRAASASSKAPPVYPNAKRDFSEPVSPGPPTATLINPQLENAKESGTRARAQSAAVSLSATSALAAQWPLDKVLSWLAANNFSTDWQETFRQLKLDGADFLDLGKGANGRGNLGMMHSKVYPQLARVCSGNKTGNKTGWDQSREREEGKRLRKLISRLGDDGPPSAGSGHRRRESGVLGSASTEGTLEGSPHLGQSEFATASPVGIGPFGPRGSQGRSSTLPVMPRGPSSSSTPVDNRGEYTRNILGNVGRGRHSPHLSGDVSTGLPAPKVDASPSSSPGLGHAVPTSSADGRRPQHSKTNSTDSMQKAANYHRGNLNFPSSSVSDNAVPTERFYEQQNRRDALESHRPSMLDTSRTYSNEQVPVSAKEGGKGFLSKFMRKNRHDHGSDVDHPLESPTSPGLRSIFSKPTANNSDSALAQRPMSTTAVEGHIASGRERRYTRTNRKYMLVTPDRWNYRLIDVTAVSTAEALKKLICEELGLLGETVTFYFTLPGQQEHEHALSDDVMRNALGRADNDAAIRIFVASAAYPASPSNTNGLSMSFSQRASGGATMLKSTSASGLPSPSHTYHRTPSPDSLRRAQDEYRKQTEAKQRAYLLQRMDRKEQSKGNVIDFDSPRVSPFEEKKADGLMPVRKPPTAPTESSTLTKVNSLRMARGGSGTRSSLEALKRISDPIVEERAMKEGKPSSGGGIGAALANAGRVAGSPAMFKGDDEEIGPGFAPKFRLQPAPRRQQTYGPSPEISPATDTFKRPTLQTRKSYGPDFEFQETNVTFAPSPHPTMGDGEDDDDDSDDGLFAIPLTNKSLPKGGEKPTLTLDTDQTRAHKPKVAFKTPNSSGGVSLGRNSNEGSAHPSEGMDRSYSDGSFPGSASASASASSPGGGLGRRNSFLHSDIWASRPTVENVVENLDEFFPGVDLDKPFMEEPGKTPTPSEKDPGSLRSRMTFGTQGLNLEMKQRSESDTLGSDESTLKARDQTAVASIAQRQMGKSGGLSRMKSIREVAQHRNVDLPGPQRAPSVVRPGPAVEQNQASGLQRRKSTKLWGANIVQIKPKAGNRLSTLDTIPQEEVPKEDAPKRSTTFKILRGQLIGKGTYGRVYLGMNATTGDFLAVKQVEVNQKTAGQDKDRIKEMVAALDLEIDTMKDLEHPNIVQYLGCDRREFSISIYLEYISGGSVGSCLRKHGKFEEGVVRSLTRQTLEGLAYLHQEGILHRDLKADNILLDTDGTCKISDFGISKKSDNIYGNDVTNSMQGSVFWMAPEVVRSRGLGYSAKIDIWSLGCVVLEMFAGKRPWSREEAIGAIFKLGNLNQAPPIPEDVQQTASVEGLAFMYACFEIKPEDRPTAATLLRESDFCVPDLNYDFMNTELAAKLRSSGLVSLGE